jgi:uncharacterized protein DUF4287
MDHIPAKTGKKSEDFWKLAIKKGFVKQDKIVVKHADLLAWLKSENGLGHVHANFIMLYLRLRTDDPKVSAQSKKWAYSTGYHELRLRSVTSLFL